MPLAQLGTRISLLRTMKVMRRGGSHTVSRVATTRPYPFSSPRSPVPLHVQYGTPLVDMINHFPLYLIISLVFSRHGRQKFNTTCQLHCNISYGPRKSC